MTVDSIARKYQARKVIPKSERVATSAMIASLAAEGYDTVDAPFGHALTRLAKDRPEIVGLTADLSKYTDLHVFAKAFPDRFFQMGMAEQLSVRAVGRSGRYELLVHHDGVVANLRDVGVGVSQVLPVLAVAYCAPPGSTVLLEEPEIHLHPLAQAVLAEVFAEVSQQRQVQFLVETHSEHLFRRMQTLIARRQASTAQCRMLFVERRGADAVLVPLDVDEFGAVRNWPQHFFGDAMGEAREQARARAQRLREVTGG